MKHLRHTLQQNYRILLLCRKEIIRFIFVGCSAVATDFILYFFLLNLLPHFPAKAFSFIGGSLIAYVANKYWTFLQLSRSNAEVLRFVILYSATLAINVSINSIILLLQPSATSLAFICATSVSTVLNFIGQKLWVFIHPDNKI